MPSPGVMERALPAIGTSAVRHTPRGTMANSPAFKVSAFVFPAISNIKVRTPSSYCSRLRTGSNAIAAAPGSLMTSISFMLLNLH